MNDPADSHYRLRYWNPGPIVSGANTTATAYVALTSPAPTGEATVALSNQSFDLNGNPLPAPIGTLPASVTIAEGLISTTFTITQIVLLPNVSSVSDM